MEKFRNLTKNIFFKIFLSFLGLTFVMFGVGDFIMGYSNSWIAKVNGQKISYNQYLKELQNNRERIYRSNPSEEVLQYLNSARFRSDVVQNMVNKSMMDLVKEYFAIYPDKELVLKDITTHPKFVDKDGQFNRIAFINFLNANNLKEDYFINEVSREIANQIIISSLIYNPKENEKLAKIAYNYKEEKRQADIVSISLKNVGKVQKPKKEDLTDFFEQNKDQFILPEFRKISYIEFSEKDITPTTINITNQDILDYYNNSSLYVNPASKDFYHLLFEDEINANKFLNKLNEEVKSGIQKDKAFIKLAKEFKDRSKADILLKNLTNQDLLPEIANDVFSIGLHENSEVLKSSLGFHIFYFVHENPESKVKLTQKIRNEIRQNLKLEKKEELLAKKIEKIDDKILTSNSLKEVAKEFNLEVKKLVKINKDGHDFFGKDILNNIKLDSFLQNSFNLPEKEASELFYSKSNSKYYVLFINEIEEARNRALDEVLGKVTDLYIREKKQEKLVQLANKIYQEIQDKKDINKIVRKNNLKIIKGKIFPRSYPVNVSGQNINYANKFLHNLFEINKGQATTAHFVSGSEMNIGIVKNIIKPKINKENLEKITESLAGEFSNNILNSYDLYIQNKFPIEVNYDLLNKQDNQE